MADWNTPTITSPYADVIDFLRARDVDAITLGLAAITNTPVGTIRYNRADNKFQEWTGAVWVDKVLSIAGGGTGGNTASGARLALGLGTISVQNAESVVITGGSITFLSSFSLATDLTFTTDGTRNIGTNGIRPSNIYVRNGLVIPVGSDKWVTVQR